MERLAGNRTAIGGQASTYDAANKLTSFPGGTAQYDADGNTLAANGTGVALSGMSWNDQNQLTEIHDPTQNLYPLDYYYDFGGRRTIEFHTGVLQRFFVYDGDTLVGEAHNARGVNIPTDYAVYTWGPSGVVSLRNGVVVPIAGAPAPPSRWYAFGPQGETRQLTNAAGSITDTYLYDSYGVPTQSAGGTTNPFRYGGQVGYYSDSQFSGNLILCGHRWYCPALGRWLSRDPIGYDGGENLYAYCGNEPIGGVDPRGMDTLVIYGENRGQGDPKEFKYFEQIAKHLAAEFNRLWGRRGVDGPHGCTVGDWAYVRSVATVQEFGDALLSGNWDQVVYVGHAGAQALYLSGRKSGVLKLADVGKLPGHVNRNIMLLGCHTGEDPGNIAQAFANRFGRETRGIDGGLSFGTIWDKYTPRPLPRESSALGLMVGGMYPPHPAIFQPRGHGR